MLLILAIPQGIFKKSQELTKFKIPEALIFKMKHTYLVIFSWIIAKRFSSGMYIAFLASFCAAAIGQPDKLKQLQLFSLWMISYIHDQISQRFSKFWLWDQLSNNFKTARNNILKSWLISHSFYTETKSLLQNDSVIFNRISRDTTRYQIVQVSCKDYHFWPKPQTK